MHRTDRFVAWMHILKVHSAETSPLVLLGLYSSSWCWPKGPTGLRGGDYIALKGIFILQTSSLKFATIITDLYCLLFAHGRKFLLLIKHYAWCRNQDSCSKTSQCRSIHFECDLQLPFRVKLSPENIGDGYVS